MASPSEEDDLDFLYKLQEAIWKLLEVVESNKTSIPQVVKEEMEKVEKLMHRM